MNSYLIPANSKKSMLILGLFTMSDFILFGVGLGISFLLLLILNVENIFIALITIAPGSICGLLVMPIPNYHNVRTAIKNAWIFITTRQKYIWKGWCFSDEEETSKK